MPAPSTDRSVILTFDDGPEHVDALESIVDTLDRERVSACFFLLGQGVDRHPDAARLLADHGHELANHGWSHARMPTLSEPEMFDELCRTQEAIHRATGVTPRRFRPPYGAGWINEKCPELIRSAARLDLRMAAWALDTYDWRDPNGIRLDRVTAFFQGSQPSACDDHLDLLMHVLHGTARDLSQLVALVRSRGFRFGGYDG
ncbi:MAG: polysaccharide deacetylase family protein [Phycisphaerae bacterium]|nr:polysaccharide deacetylase family protein [Phycisphaerae bacterium]